MAGERGALCAVQSLGGVQDKGDYLSDGKGRWGSLDRKVSNESTIVIPMVIANLFIGASLYA
jgi:hypothetical protein